jgi:hypothetical protein
MGDSKFASTKLLMEPTSTKPLWQNDQSTPRHKNQRVAHEKIYHYQRCIVKEAKNQSIHILRTSLEAK